MLTQTGRYRVDRLGRSCDLGGPLPPPAEIDDPLEVFYARGAAILLRSNVFRRLGGFDPGINYHDDRTSFYKIDSKVSVVKDAYCYHNNPDIVREMFRRNYWIGRTYLAASSSRAGPERTF